MHTGKKKNTVLLTAGTGIRLCSLLLALFLCTGVQAQKNSNTQASKFLTQVPFTTFTGGVVLIKAQLVG